MNLQLGDTCRSFRNLVPRVFHLTALAPGGGKMGTRMVILVFTLCLCFKTSFRENLSSWKWGLTCMKIVEATRKRLFMWSLSDIFPPPGKFRSLWDSHQSIPVPHTCLSSECFLHSSPRMTSGRENKLSCFNPPYPPQPQPRPQIQAYLRKPRVILTEGKWFPYRESQKGSLWFGQNMIFFR